VVHHYYKQTQTLFKIMKQIIAGANGIMQKLTKF